MISVEQALARIFDLVHPLGRETVALSQASGRVLAAPVVANRDQPPFASSVMDGYGVQASDAGGGTTLKVIGEAAAGRGFDGIVKPGEAVRIFTGAPVPAGVGHVVIQEDVARNGDQITLNDAPNTQPYIRAAGADFKIGDTLDGPRLLGPHDLALLASMNIARVDVGRRPVVAIMATGDELVMPGETPGPDQIIASNSFGLMALAQNAGADARMLPIARDNAGSLEMAFSLATGADLIVTIGGASEGDHDLVGAVAKNLGMQSAFYKIAMRPGKPLMAGKFGDGIMLGLPGNPVSSMVCGHIFMLPTIRAMQGLPPRATARRTAQLAIDIAANGPREHYMRALVEGDTITPYGRQDSALLSVLSQANALMVRPPNDGSRQRGEPVEYVAI